jgi:ribose transport system substrate-binding protein
MQCVPRSNVTKLAIEQPGADERAKSVADRSESQTVLRACAVLKAFAHAGEELPLNAVIERTGLPKTTVFRLLRTLVHGGMVEKTARGTYRNSLGPALSRRFRIGFAAQGETEFSREVARSVEAVAERENVQLVSMDNGYSARTALRNAELMVNEKVDLMIEFQTFERVAPVISEKFQAAGIPMLAVEVPHPGAVYFGADNYRAGLMGGRALGRWARENWEGRAEQLLLLDLPIAGSLLELRLVGFIDGLRAELPHILDVPMVRLNGRGSPDQVLDEVRKYLRRCGPRRTLVGTVNDICALAAVRAFEDAGASALCAVMGQNALRAVRDELRRPGTRLIGSVAYFPERYGEDLIPLAMAMLQKRPIPSAIFVKHQLLTARNVDEVYALDAPVRQSTHARDDAARPLQPSWGCAAQGPLLV